MECDGWSAAGGAQAMALESGARGAGGRRAAGGTVGDGGDGQGVVDYGGLEGGLGRSSFEDSDDAGAQKGGPSWTGTRLVGFSPLVCAPCQPPHRAMGAVPATIV